MVENDIQILENLNDYSQAASTPAVQAARVVDSPAARVEEKLVDVVQHAFSALNEEDELGEAINAELVSRLPNMDDKVLINLKTSHAVNRNDQFSKAYAPLITLMTAEQQAAIQEAGRREARQERLASANQNNITINTGNSMDQNQARNLNETLDTAIISGLNDIFKVAAVYKQAKQINAEKEAEAVEAIVKDE